jgi:flavodoxin
MKALIIYWSGTGNTEKVAVTIYETLKNSGINSTLKRVGEALTEDLYEYDLVFIGSPSHQWQPAAPVLKYVLEKFKYYKKSGNIKLGAPKLSGKWGVVFVTYSGPHTGINEATPVGKYLCQFFEHLGFSIAGQLYTVGEHRTSLEKSTGGRLGDIRGRPNKKDLNYVSKRIKRIIENIPG